MILRSVKPFDLAGVKASNAGPYSQRLRSIELQITAAPREVAFVFAESGHEQLRKMGERSEVEFSEVEVLQMRDCCLTHNHPNKGFFSPADIVFAHKANLAQMRAVSGETVYILDRPLAGWNKSKALNLYNAGIERIIKLVQIAPNPKKVERELTKLTKKLVKELSLVVRTETL